MRPLHILEPRRFLTRFVVHSFGIVMWIAFRCLGGKPIDPPMIKSRSHVKHPLRFLRGEVMTFADVFSRIIEFHGRLHDIAVVVGHAVAKKSITS